MKIKMNQEKALRQFQQRNHKNKRKGENNAAIRKKPLQITLKRFCFNQTALLIYLSYICSLFTL